MPSTDEYGTQYPSRPRGDSATALACELSSHAQEAFVEHIHGRGPLPIAYASTAMLHTSAFEQVNAHRSQSSGKLQGITAGYGDKRKSGDMRQSQGHELF
ncbi:hypothetical protein RBB50_001228 [Rhinocladiella similis]